MKRKTKKKQRKKERLKTDAWNAKLKGGKGRSKD